MSHLEGTDKRRTPEQSEHPDGVDIALAKEEIGSEFRKARYTTFPHKDIFELDLSLGREENIKRLKEKLEDDVRYAEFIGNIADGERLSDEVTAKMLMDNDLKEQFLELTDIAVMISLPQDRIEKLYRALFEYLMEHFRVKNPVKYIKSARVKTVSLRKNYLVLNNEKSNRLFAGRHKVLVERRNKGDISEEEYRKELRGVYEEVAEESGDEELAKLIESEQSLETIVDKFEKFVFKNDDKKDVPVETKKETNAAVEEVNTVLEGTLEADFSDTGVAVIKRGNFSVDLLVHKGLTVSSGDEFLYYIRDPYSGDGDKGPFRAKDLLVQIKARSIDAYVTQSVLDKSSNPDMHRMIREDVPDFIVTELGESLIESIGFDITGSDREVLDRLVQFLITENSKDGSLVDKIKKLHTYVMRDRSSNAQVVRDNLVRGELSIESLTNV